MTLSPWKVVHGKNRTLVFIQDHGHDELVLVRSEEPKHLRGIDRHPLRLMKRVPGKFGTSFLVEKPRFNPSSPSTMLISTFLREVGVWALLS